MISLYLVYQIDFVITLRFVVAPKWKPGRNTNRNRQSSTHTNYIAPYGRINYILRNIYIYIYRTCALFRILGICCAIICVLFIFVRIHYVHSVINNPTQLSGRGFPHAFYINIFLSLEWGSKGAGVFLTKRIILILCCGLHPLTSFPAVLSLFPAVLLTPPPPPPPQMTSFFPLRFSVFLQRGLCTGVACGSSPRSASYIFIYIYTHKFPLDATALSDAFRAFTQDGSRKLEKSREYWRKLEKSREY